MSMELASPQLMEFSGLAWDEDEKRLYALSDRGFVTHLRPVFENEQLVDIQLIAKYTLKDTGGKDLSHKYADSEGITLLNANNGKPDDTEFIISFERVPRIIRYTTTGDFIAKEPIKNSLNEISHYAGANNSLEAITLHKQFGIITGPERPLINSKDNQLSLYTGQQGMALHPA